MGSCTFFSKLVYRITPIASALALLAATSAPYANADEASELGIPPASHTSCSYSKNDPCPKLLKEHGDIAVDPDSPSAEGADPIAIAAGYCKMMQMNDKLCSHNRKMAFTYTALASTCALACFSNYFTGGTAEFACAWGTMANALYDAYISFGASSGTKQWSDDKASALNGELARQGLAVGIGIGTPINMVLWRTLSDSARTRAKGVSCTSMGVNALMAGLKFASFKYAKKHSDDIYVDMCKIEPENCRGQEGPGGPGSLDTKPLVAQTGAGTTPFGSADSRGEVDDFVKEIKEALADGNIAESAATAQDIKNGFLPSDPRQSVDEALKSLGSAGISPEQLAESLATSGVGGTLAQLPGLDDETKKNLRDMDKALEREKTMASPAFAYESTSSGGSVKKSAASPFSFGKRETASASGGAKGVKFGGFKGDIWHAGSTKSIFEIVSDKTSDVSIRVID